MFLCYLLLLSKRGRCCSNWNEVCGVYNIEAIIPNLFFSMSDCDLWILRAKNTEAMQGKILADITVGGHMWFYSLSICVSKVIHRHIFIVHKMWSVHSGATQRKEWLKLEFMFAVTRWFSCIETSTLFKVLIK